MFCFGVLKFHMCNQSTCIDHTAYAAFQEEQFYRHKLLYRRYRTRKESTYKRQSVKTVLNWYVSRLTCAFRVDIRGDCFVSKTFDDEDTFKRVDITIEEYNKLFENPPDPTGRYVFV